MCSYIKYLGILIDEVLSWNKLIESIFIKLAEANETLSKLRYFIHYSLFYIHLIYGCLVSPYFRKSNIDRLIKQQQRCIQIIKFPDFDFYTNFQYSELKLFKVNNSFFIEEASFYARFYKGKNSRRSKGDISHKIKTKQFC